MLSKDGELVVNKGSETVPTELITEAAGATSS